MAVGISNYLYFRLNLGALKKPKSEDQRTNDTFKVNYANNNNKQTKKQQQQQPKKKRQ